MVKEESSNIKPAATPSLHGIKLEYPDEATTLADQDLDTGDSKSNIVHSEF